MKIAEVVEQIEKNGGKLWVEESTLRCKGKEQLLTPELKQFLKKYKFEIIEYLNSRNKNVIEFPLSYSQQRLWFIHQLADGDMNAYNEPCAVLIKHDLSIELLQLVLNQLFQQHEILRVKFVEDNGIPKQVVQNLATLPLQVIQLKHLDIIQDKLEIDTMMSSYAWKSFDIGRDILIKPYLFQFSQSCNILLLVIHHILVDKWAIHLLLQELFERYRCALVDKIYQTNIKQNYFAFIDWERTARVNEEAGLKFWKKHLLGAPELVEFPYDGVRQKLQGYDGETENLLIDGQLAKQIESLSKKHGVTIFTVYLAAFYLLLARYMKQYDVVIGIPVAGRSKADFESTIGLFANTLALRINADHNLSIANLFNFIKTKLTDALSHQDIPFERVVEFLQLKRDLRYHSIFQVMFVMQNMPGIEIAELQDAISMYELPVKRAQFDISLIVDINKASVNITLEYNVELIKQATAKRLLQNYQEILQKVFLNDISLELNQLNFLSHSEYDLLSFWNNTEYPELPALSFWDLFIQQQLKSPQQIALRYLEKSITYKELYERCINAAKQLYELGVRCNNRVVVYQKRDEHLIINFMALLYLGAIYIPLDPTYTSSRNQYIIDQSQANFILTTKAYSKLLETSLNDDKPIIINLEYVETKDLPLICSPANYPTQHLAYILFTSGSTGKPKGAMIEHHGMMNHLWAKILDLNMTETDIVAQIASQSFDISIWQMLAGLMVGASIDIIPDEITHDIILLRDAIANRKHTIVEVVPTVLRFLLAHSQDLMSSDLSSLRWMIPTGEALTPGLAQDWLNKYPKIPLLNAYGPTECSDDVTHAKINHLSKEDLLCISIGKPIINTKTYVLDDDLQLLPIGAIGQLYIGGEGVGQGYFNDSARTALAFVPNPFSHEPGKRLYRTGDLVRYRYDGNIEFVGRVDQQVKIRGFRIELGEIENTISKLKDLASVVVKAFKDQNGSDYLLAFVQMKNSIAFDEEQLFRILKQKLPHYMIPRKIIHVDTFPLLENGKIDRKALLAPDFEKEELQKKIPPQTHLQQCLLEIWQSVLKINEISIRDDFFLIGGHSLIATQILVKIKQDLNMTCSVKDIFAYPTIEEFSLFLESNLSSDTTEKITINTVDRENALPISYSQERLWFLYELDDKQGNSYNVPFALKLNGKLDIKILQKSIDILTIRHETLRTNFVNIDGQARPIIHNDIKHVIDIVDLKNQEIEAQKSIVMQLQRNESSYNFNLERDLLVRIKLALLNSNESILLLTMHHIISDGWSLGILFKELTKVYTDLINDLSVELPPLTTQYVDYAHWQRQYLNEERMSKQFAFWQKQLEGYEQLNFPTDYPRKSVQIYTNAIYQTVISQELTSALRILASKNKTSLFILLLSALNILLYKYCCQKDIVLGTAIANRHIPGTESIVGFFVNSLVLRHKITPAQLFVDFLQQVNSNALNIYENQDLPFEKLVEKISPVRDLSRSPIFQLLFVMQNIANFTSLELPHVTSEIIMQSQQTSKYDMSLTVVENAQDLSLLIEYNQELLAPETIIKFSQAYCFLLKQIVDYPNHRLRDYSIWPTPLSYPQQRSKDDKCSLRNLWLQQVANSPDSIAVVFDDKTYSYIQVDRMCTYVSEMLIDSNIYSRARVAICLPRSLSLIIAFLAIIKANLTYVPVDIETPILRRDYILEDANVSLVISGEQHTSIKTLILNDTFLMNIDTSLELQTFDPPSSVNDTAYIIYTSGTTGKPKGVQISQQNICARINTLRDLYKIKPQDVFLHYRSYNFDGSFEELLLPIFCGARVIMSDPEIKEDLINQLVNYIDKFSVTVINLMPSVLTLFIPFCQKQSAFCQSLRLVISGGEALKVHLVKQFKEVFKCGLMNTYGPTENTIDSHYWPCLTDYQYMKVPIGKALIGCEDYVLDETLQLLPDGAVGELYLSGEGLATGYLNRSRITANTFLPNCFNGAVGERMYKTGDLVRRLPDGNLEFLGRTDNQIKLRGYRIELGEIEAVCNEFKAIKQAHVEILDYQAQHCLVAYLVFYATPITMDVKDSLRTYLESRLPAYMLPTFIIILDKIPLNLNGKVDSESLPKPRENDRFWNQNYVEPNTMIAKKLAKLWGELLHVSKVSLYDNFFVLGGHSLLATQLMIRIREEFSVDVSLRHLFKHSTLSSQSDFLAQHLKESANFPRAEIKSVSREIKLPLSFAQQRLWFLDKIIADRAAYNIISAVELTGTINKSAIEFAYSQMIIRHEILRTVITEEQGIASQKILSDVKYPLYYRDFSKQLLESQSESIKIYLNKLSKISFNLNRGPLCQLHLLKLSDNVSILALIMHHIIFDLWSEQILFDEFSKFYNMFTEGKIIELMPLSVQYADFAFWQREWLEGDICQQQLQYWLHELKDLANAKNMFAKEGVTTQCSGDGASETIIRTIDSHLSANIKQFVNKYEVTSYMFLLAIFFIVLSRTSKQTDLVIGTPVANRHYPGVDKLIGFFVNTLIIRAEISSKITFIKFLEIVKNKVLLAYDNQDIPFEMLVNKLDVEHDANNRSIFQVMFSLQTYESHWPNFKQLSLKPIPVETGAAKFVINLVSVIYTDKIELHFEYDNEIFSQQSIKKIIDNYVFCVEKFLEDPSLEIIL